MLLTTGPSWRRCWVSTIAPAVAARSSATVSAAITATGRLRALTVRPGCLAGSDSRAGRAGPGVGRRPGLVVAEHDGDRIALGRLTHLAVHRLCLGDSHHLGDDRRARLALVLARVVHHDACAEGRRGVADRPDLVLALLELGGRLGREAGGRGAVEDGHPRLPGRTGALARLARLRRGGIGVAAGDLADAEDDA